MERIVAGDYVKHFKRIESDHPDINPLNHLYHVESIGRYTDEPNNLCVVYKSVTVDGDVPFTWVRNYDEFMGKVNRDGVEKYRFEKVDIEYIREQYRKREAIRDERDKIIDNLR